MQHNRGWAIVDYEERRLALGRLRRNEKGMVPEEVGGDVTRDNTAGRLVSILVGHGVRRSPGLL